MKAMREIEQAHDCPVSCLVYSQRLSSVVTCASDGYCHIWDFQTARNLTQSLQLSKEPTALALVDQYPVLLTGDMDGVVLLWRIGLHSGRTTPIMRLSTGGDAVSPMSAMCVLDRSPLNQTAALLLAMNEAGEISRWDLDKVLEEAGIQRECMIPPCRLSILLSHHEDVN
jgi:WD40 repeat protein